MNVPQPLVTVVVPTRNRWATTQRFLTAIAQQTYPHLRVIVVDANSSDGTPAQIQQQFPQVQLLQVGDQCYWAGSTNAGVRLALAQDSDYVLTINDDAVIESDHIAQLVHLAQTQPCLILGNQINYLADRDRIWALGTYTDWGSAKFLTLAYHNVPQQDLPQAIGAAAVIEVDALPGNGVLIHRSVFEQVGLYQDRWLPHYHADSELIMRARQQGIAAFVTPRVTLYNDFSREQKQMRLRSLDGLTYALFHPRSHLFMLPIVYIFIRYCPPRAWISTAKALSNRGMQLMVKGSPE
jgi:GT2 family glycosyltransferase